jgi:hypothetical protein
VRGAHEGAPHVAEERPERVALGAGARRDGGGDGGDLDHERGGQVEGEVRGAGEQIEPTRRPRGCRLV